VAGILSLYVVPCVARTNKTTTQRTTMLLTHRETRGRTGTTTRRVPFTPEERHESHDTPTQGTAPVKRFDGN